MTADNLRDDIRALLNRHSAEAGSDTPDSILADYFIDALHLFERTVIARERWYGRGLPMAARAPAEIPAEWAAPESFSPDDRVLWRGAELVCLVDHYAGQRATHPWDPGGGWRSPRAAGLWAPGTAESAETLRAMEVGDGRLQDVLCAVVRQYEEADDAR
jgi:hypothetical protein